MSTSNRLPDRIARFYGRLPGFSLVVRRTAGPIRSAGGEACLTAGWQPVTRDRTIRRLPMGKAAETNAAATRPGACWV